MNRFIVLSLGVLMLSITAGAQAQEESWDNLRSLRAGEKIQVVDQKLKSQNGTFVSVSDEAITFQAGKDAVTVQRADVFRVSSREHHKRLRNTLIGLAAGAAVGAASGAREAGNPDWPGGAAGAALLAIPLGGIGAGIGAALPPGHPTIYRVQRKQDQRAP